MASSPGINLQDQIEQPKKLADPSIVIIGGGPAGLAAGYELIRLGARPLILEKAGQVGGIARTENYQGYYFDMGGHRFFTKSAEVNQFWHEVLGDDFLLRPRLSRIYYNRKFFNYPLKPFNALTGLGIIESVRVGLSYLRWQIAPYPEEVTFEQWVTNRFGDRLFRIFFKSYTEKVWGISTSELSAEWAAQRIKDLDLKAAVTSMFLKPKKKIKTLIEEFNYPARGPGMLWNQTKDAIESRGGEVWMNTRVCGFNRDGQKIVSVKIEQDGQTRVIPGSHFISSAPVTEFIEKLSPPAPNEVQLAAKSLHYRDFLTVCLIVDQAHLFEDNWIYIHDPKVTVGRIQNFKNWSPFMVPDSAKTSLGLEYFCNEGDQLWTMPDEELIELGKRELEQIGLAKAADVIDGAVFRVEKSYPVYDSTYRTHLDIIRAYIDQFENFQTIGRNGLHRYNNQDHAMLTGMYAARNIILNQQNDLWVVNAEQEYHEEVQETLEPDFARIAEDVFARGFLKLDPLGFAVATGLTAGLAFGLITLLFNWFPDYGIVHFVLLFGQFFPYYQVTSPGIILGFLYGSLVGFIFGFLLAGIRNFSVRTYFWLMIRRARRSLLVDKAFNIDVQSGSSDVGDMESGE